MGTACLIGGRGGNSIRGQRTRRKTLVETLYREAMDPRRAPANRIAVHAIANELNAIRNYPSRSGADKETRFKVVINRPTFQSPT